MKQSELAAEITKYQWFHKIWLPYDGGGCMQTPGIVDHCLPKIATERFGIPEVLLGKTVLDVGAFDGYFSFLAESRGADVRAIDSMQDCSNLKHAHEPFKLAAKVLGSKVKLLPTSLKDYDHYYGFDDFGEDVNTAKRDIVFYFGVLYHCDDPISELRALRSVTNEYAIIETAVYKAQNVITMWDNELWKFRPGHNGDPTNKWYPTIPALRTALLHVGFSKLELVHITPDRERVTVKAYV